MRDATKRNSINDIKISNDMEGILIPIFVCVVLPVAIVLIAALSKMNADNKRSQVLIKAIESNCDINADKLAEALSKPQKPKKTAREILNLRLLRGCIFTLIGIPLLAFGTYNLATRSPEICRDYPPISVSTVFGGISLALGISYLIVYFVTRKQADKPEDK